MTITRQFLGIAVVSGFVLIPIVFHGGFLQRVPHDSRKATKTAPSWIIRRPINFSHSILQRPAEVSYKSTNPFKAAGGAWVWITRHNWITTIWYVPGPRVLPRPIEVIDNRDPMGVDCSYSVSPDGRWILYWWCIAGSVDIKWGLMDRLHNRCRHILCPTGGWDFSDPIWQGSKGLFFRRYYWNDGVESTVPDEVWFLRLSDFSLRRRNKLHGEKNIEQIFSYYTTYDATLQANLRRLHHFPQQYLSDMETLLSKLLEGRWDWAAFPGISGMIVLPGAASVAVCDNDLKDSYLIRVYSTQTYKLLGRLEISSWGDRRLSSVRAISQSEICFTSAHPRAAQGVGSDTEGYWGPRLHPSRLYTQICRWNFRTNRLSVIAEGENAMRLPPQS